MAKWRKRSSTADLPTGPKEPKSTVLSVEDEAIIVAIRGYTLLLLDDRLYALQATLAHLTRSPDFAWTAERADDWRLPWAGYTMTRYGRKAEREGRQAAYLRFQKIS